MKEYPILFNSEMIRAILEGRKTQTRRISKIHCASWRPELGMYHPIKIDKKGYETPGNEVFGASDEEYAEKSPFGKVGDRLWVRETFCHPTDINGAKHVFYKATETQPMPSPWTPSIHMPRKLCRIILEITDIRVERLNDISEEDAKKEGCDGNCPIGCIPDHQASPCEYHFAQLWDSIYEKQGIGWDANPWVWAVEFKVLEK